MPNLGAGKWDAITVNPPYMKVPSGAHNQNARMNLARHEVECTLEDVIRTSARLIKEQGPFLYGSQAAEAGGDTERPA